MTKKTLTVNNDLWQPNPVPAIVGIGFSSSVSEGGQRHYFFRRFFMSTLWLCLIFWAGRVGGFMPAGCLWTGLLTCLICPFCLAAEWVVFNTSIQRSKA